MRIWSMVTGTPSIYLIFDYMSTIISQSFGYHINILLNIAAVVVAGSGPQIDSVYRTITINSSSSLHVAERANQSPGNFYSFLMNHFVCFFFITTTFGLVYGVGFSHETSFVHCGRLLSHWK